MPLLLLLLLHLLLPPSHSSCGTSHHHLLSLAFSRVSNFRPPAAAGACLRHLLLPSQNLSGTLSWMFLRNITTLQTLDLSNNSLDGSIPGGFWSSPSLSSLNLAGNNLGGPLRLQKSNLLSLNLSQNRFSTISNISLLRRVKILDLSQNKIFLAPPGLSSLPNVTYLDLSRNSMAGEFPGDLPAIAGLRFLNLSCNNFTGVIDAAALGKFGSSAFAKGGIFTYAEAKGSRKRRKKVILAAVAGAAGIGVFAAVLAGVYWFCGRGLKEEEGGEEKGEENEWVKEARMGAEVVVFEKPLMELRFGDLVAATCGFGRESLMAEEGRMGKVYRAVLGGDMNVVVRVMEREREVEEAEAAFREVGILRHRNILPLLGYCISGWFFFMEVLLKSSCGTFEFLFTFKNVKLIDS